ncbi:MAG: L,D-transpeptidase [Pseudomonadota bacterium]|nr:L,D-transpeptidase [Pseudomonadota bacterium]
MFVSLADQRLGLWRAGAWQGIKEVSTALRGAGERNGSGQTPRGWHRIRARIGTGVPRGGVFVGRRFTGEIWSEALAGAAPDRDWILTRILWLGGEEPGANRFGTVDTGKRFIYIHGTPEVDRLGQPVSHGCVRMACADVEWLFDAVSAGTPVFIGEAPMDALAA